MEPYEIVVDAKEEKVSFMKFPPTIEIIRNREGVENPPLLVRVRKLCWLSDLF